MNKEQAKKLIQNTFESSFDKEKFVVFVKNLLNHVEESPFIYRGNYIPDAFEQYISTLERIGKYPDGEDEIDLLIVKLKRETSLERARTMQRNFIAWYLKGSRGGKLKDAALVAFISSNEEDWRFSLVKMEYRFEEGQLDRIKVREVFTPARRWSFLVGKNEKSHTAQRSLVSILEDDVHNPTLAQLEEAFNIEPVTREFFNKYRNLLIRAVDALDEVVNKDETIRKDLKLKNINTIDFTKKLLGQIVFLYFLQKKGWFGVERDTAWGIGPKDFLRRLFNKEYGDYKNFFNDILEPLFYEALARERDDNFYSRFNCRIPFLNGGLFEPIGGYTWVYTDILLPNELFSNSHRTPEGDKGDGILDVFDRFNFTVKEDEPLEKEVAIDPELLGKLYEKFNAIRPDNFYEYKKALTSGKRNLEKQFNKKFGVYYTPREIVHYMCQQSLINYLHTTVNQELMKQPARTPKQIKLIGPDEPEQLRFRTDKEIVIKQDIERLINYGEQFTENEAIVEEKGKETKTYKYQLPESIRENAKFIDDKLKVIKICDPTIGSGAFLVGMMHEIVKARNVLSAFINGSGRSIYTFKRECIENSLYGVDIDSGACEVAKLRLWLSLIVDEEDIRIIKPLPNLDYKIVCGNSLLGVERDLLNDELFAQLEKLKPLYFNEPNPTKKQEYKKQIEELISNITYGHKKFDFKVYFSQIFHQKGGFDVVIANPPYVEHKKLKDISSEFRKFYSTYSGTADLYVYFYEKGLDILKDNGTLEFITSNKFIRTRYGEKLRKHFLDFKINEIIDFTEVHVFEALVASCIFSISKIRTSDNKIKVAFANDSLLDFSGVAKCVNENGFYINQSTLNEKIWQLENETKLALKEKIDRGSLRIKEIDTINIYRGVTTGYNAAFIVDNKKKEELVKKYKVNNDIIKPLLQGRNIRKWVTTKSGKFLLFIPWHFPLHTNTSIYGASEKAEKEFNKLYPAIYKHLLEYKNSLSKRNKEETGVRYEWYALQRCAASYYSEFVKEKIVWGLTADKWAFAYDNQKHYLPSNGYILTSKEISIKYLLALMNSRLIEFYFNFIGIMTAGGAFTLKHETVDEFPIKLIANKEQGQFIEIVNKILSLTQSQDYLENLQKQGKVKAYERQIDQMVYRLYCLTYEEIKIVEDYEK